MPRLKLALDLEHTLIGNAVSRFPRPGLRSFLDWAGARFGPDNIVIYTAVSHEIWQDVATHLVADGFAPGWFADLKHLQPEKPLALAWGSSFDDPVKDLRRVCPDIDQVIIVDDYMEYIRHDQRHRWVRIEPWERPDGDTRDADADRELDRVRSMIEKLADRPR